jgi:hypothetical protein
MRQKNNAILSPTGESGFTSNKRAGVGSEDNDMVDFREVRASVFDTAISD